MRTNHFHGALLLVLAMVMAMMSIGICTVTASAITPSSVENTSPPLVHTCLKILSNRNCDKKACKTDCFTKLKGAGMRIIGGVKGECLCSYLCTPPHPRMPHATAAARMVTD